MLCMQVSYCCSSCCTHAVHPCYACMHACMHAGALLLLSLLTGYSAFLYSRLFASCPSAGTYVHKHDVAYDVAFRTTYKYA